MKQFLFLSFALFFIACGNRYEENSSPVQVLLDLTNNERYVSVDQVADWMINKDPSLLLVDVRDHMDYDAFTLPGAYNIPLVEIPAPENQTLLDCSRRTIVYFSNDDLKAEQAWLANHKNCRGSFIMQGGLNQWTSAILNMKEPNELASAEELELYQFRKAVCQYFIGASDELEPEKYQVIQQPVAIKKNINLKPKKKKVEEEGC